MLKGIAACISPELLAVLHRMGHGDEIILADAHFPGHSIGPHVCAPTASPWPRCSTASCRYSSSTATPRPSS